jgi:hypothetical protein
MPDDHDLGELIARLTEPRLVDVTDQDGITTAVRRPPLLHELDTARTASVGVGRGGAQQRHERTMLNIEASELLTQIERRVRAWCRRAGMVPTGPAWPRVDRLLADWAWAAGDAAHPSRLRQLATWVQAIEDLVDPPRRYTLSAACPICGTSYVDTAEQHGRALQVVERHPAARTEVLCRSCSHAWRGLDGARELAALIGAAS